MRIGRGADNEIIIGDAAKGVSRAHAELHVENGRCTIVDLHSQNGTWVNALRVQRAEVRPDQEIAIGVFRLRLQTGTPSVSATGRPGPRPQPATVARAAAADAGGLVTSHSGAGPAATSVAAGAARSGHRSAADVTVGGRHQSGADAGGARPAMEQAPAAKRKEIEPAVDLRRRRRPRDDWARLRAVQPSAEEDRRTRGRARAGCAAACPGRTGGRASGAAGRRAANSRGHRTSSTARSSRKARGDRRGPQRRDRRHQPRPHLRRRPPRPSHDRRPTRRRHPRRADARRHRLAAIGAERRADRRGRARRPLRIFPFPASRARPFRSGRRAARRCRRATPSRRSRSIAATFPPRPVDSPRSSSKSPASSTRRSCWSRRATGCAPPPPT